ncbi:hypothetical protein FLM48_16505 [Shewanella sp. Scap07]|uniref:hypothetical protein n=1 Tax=Shewanella sp. Scap07 TaxID=2589987 RepID=UPI0015C09404|nr:hypothetical protein [Shewanella sp. Scap07]QLE86524.1 hypothetical protein FLM48_16505 [Shewanella sp. Scap07]
MPLSNSEARSHSVLETSLTELAFTFFFILAIFASWKISDTADALHKQEEISMELNEQVSVLTESLSEASKFAALGDEFDPEELFIELSRGKEASRKLEKAQEKQKKLEDEVEKYSALIGDQTKLDIQKVADKILEYEKVKEILENSINTENGDIVEQVKQLQNNVNDMTGQNANLRNKLEALGNGLDHPPCWANQTTGSIEYVFDIVINESSVVVHKGWPDSRKEQALTNINITKSLGVYNSNGSLWNATEGLFEESKLRKCRHFVRVYDHSESKRAFKLYLSGIENHFYKFLSSSTYE